MRHKTLIEPVRYKISLPPDLSEEIEKRMFDPVLQRRKYGAISDLITKLLKDWVEANPVNPLAEEHFDKESKNAASNL